MVWFVIGSGATEPTFVLLEDSIEGTCAIHVNASRRARYMPRGVFLFLSAFLASGVEMVEALTIVLAVGVTRGWRSTLLGAGAAALGLAAIVAVLEQRSQDRRRGGRAAFVIVLAVGTIVRPPLSRVPENGLKFVVGLLLTSFGTFWAGKGAGVSWPGDDASLLGILGLLLATSLTTVRLLRRRRGIARMSADPSGARA
jgi:uncharacterized membrane protein